MGNANTSHRVPIGVGGGSAQVFTSAAAVLTTNGTAKAIVQLPARADGAKFIKIRAVVEVTAITGNLTIEIRNGLLASDTVVVTSGAITTPGVGVAALWFEGSFNGADNKLNGFKEAYAGTAPTAVARAVSTGALTANTAQNLNITLTFGTSGTARLVEFDVDFE